MKIRPLHDNVAITINKQKEVSAGGIVLPGAAKEDSNQGEVLEIGPGRILESGDTCPMHVGVGDVVVFHAQAGSTLKTDAGEVTILPEANIIAILN
jgi:chaperonin GroES